MNERHPREAFLDATLPHLDALYSLARHLTRQRCDAEDLVQETLLRAYAHFDQFHGDSMRSWLAAICLNTARSAGRRRARRPVEVLGAELDDLLPPHDAVPDLALAHLDRDEIRSALSQIPDVQALCVILMDVAGYTASETAQALGCPRGTVLARAHRGRRRLARLLTDTEVRDDLQ